MRLPSRRGEALARTRASSGSHGLPHDSGFTLVEMLVVVIVIGVLAAIAIPIYAGVTQGARQAATRSDLTHAKQAVVGYAIGHSDAVPSSVGDDGVAGPSGYPLAPLGWSRSARTVSLVYRLAGSGSSARWCVDGLSETGTRYRVSMNSSVATGTCADLTEAKY